MKDNARENMHRLLDGDIPAGEKDALLREIDDDPVLKREFEGLAGAVERLAREGRMQPPLAFTASVMRRLPAPAEKPAGRLKRLLFGGRVLRWNRAAALGLVLLTAVTTVLMMRQLTDIGRGPTGPSLAPGGQTVLVRLLFAAPDARSVAVAGNFNQWRTDSHAMVRKDGMWSITLPLQPGVYTYMFIVNNEQWVSDPRAETYRDDGFGHQNAVMRVAL